MTLNEAKVLRPRREPWALRLRPRPVLEVKTEAKDKFMNKKYQMMTDNIQLNLYIIMIKTTHFNFSFSLTQ